jgi:hypothetical protein
MMKTLTTSIMLLLATILSITVLRATSTQTFTGEIMDVQCGLVKTHDLMMKQKGSKDAAECTGVCVKEEGKVVLYDSAHQKVYLLEDQQEAIQYAGQQVVVTGTYGNDNNTIHVDSVRAI